MPRFRHLSERKENNCANREIFLWVFRQNWPKFAELTRQSAYGGRVQTGDVISGKTYHILLAEDDDTNREIVRAFLSDQPDLELTEAVDGRVALEAALLRKFDLMIFDQNMPYITGDRVIRHLRATRTLNAETPVIRFTAAADLVPGPIRTVNAISEVTLPKPLRREALVQMIRTMLGTA